MIPDFVKDQKGFLDTYLGRIPEEEKAQEDLYEKRLQACDSCPDYQNGMCRMCGCFVAVRAAVRKQYCPGVPGRW